MINVIICIAIIVLVCAFRFKPRHSKNMYSQVLAHRGLHLFYPENTLNAYEAAKNANLAIELDIRYTKDGEVVCFHDRYTKRLLNIPGKISMFNLETIKKYNVLSSPYKVPTLKEALERIHGDVDILVEVKGKLNASYLNTLVEIQKDYPYIIYFHTKNILNYIKLKKTFKTPKVKRVYFVCNIFRKRFNFVKGKDYDLEQTKYNELSSQMDVEIPNIEDISNIIVQSIEELENKKEILATIGSVLNRYESRVKLMDKEHFVYNSIWFHRGIVSNKYKEHSKEAFLECIDFAKRNEVSVTVEFDVMLYKGEVRCFHKDKASSFIWQEKSSAEKLDLDSSLKLKDILNIFKGEKRISLAIDIKDFRLRDRTLEDLIIRDIKETGYDGNFIIMSFNPYVLSYMKTVEPNWLRAQIGNSMKGLKKIPIFRFPVIVNGIMGMLFDKSSADCVVLDNSNWIFYLIAYNRNVKGKPVLIYAPKSYMEMESFVGKESVANFIIENVTDRNAWPAEYIHKFRKI